MDRLEMMRPVPFACGLALLLAGCAKPVPVRPVPVAPVLLLAPPEAATPATIVPVRKTVTLTGRCPSAAEIRRLRAARPKPLRTQPMPASPAERVARTSAQLGLYEAQGAWADQVEDALARCTSD